MVDERLLTPGMKQLNCSRCGKPWMHIIGKIYRRVRNGKLRHYDPMKTKNPVKEKKSAICVECWGDKEVRAYEKKHISVMKTCYRQRIGATKIKLSERGEF